MADLEQYYLESNMLQTPKMIAVKIVKWIIAREKYILLTLWRMQSQLQVFLLPVNFESDGMTSCKHGSKCFNEFETSWFHLASEVPAMPFNIAWSFWEPSFFKKFIFCILIADQFNDFSSDLKKRRKKFKKLLNGVVFCRVPYCFAKMLCGNKRIVHVTQKGTNTPHLIYFPK